MMEGRIGRGLSARDMSSASIEGKSVVGGLLAVPDQQSGNSRDFLQPVAKEMRMMLALSWGCDVLFLAPNSLHLK